MNIFNSWKAEKARPKVKPQPISVRSDRSHNSTICPIIDDIEFAALKDDDESDRDADRDPFLDSDRFTKDGDADDYLNSDRRVVEPTALPTYGFDLKSEIGGPSEYSGAGGGGMKSVFWLYLPVEVLKEMIYVIKDSKIKMLRCANFDSLIELKYQLAQMKEQTKTSAAQQVLEPSLLIYLESEQVVLESEFLINTY